MGRLFWLLILILLVTIYFKAPEVWTNMLDNVQLLLALVYDWVHDLSIQITDLVHGFFVWLANPKVADVLAVPLTVGVIVVGIVGLKRLLFPGKRYY